MELNNEKNYTSSSSIPASEFTVIGQDLDSLNEITRPSISFWKDAFGRLRKDKAAIVCLLVLAAIILGCIFVPMFSGYGMEEQNYAAMNAPIFSKIGNDFYVLGTDMLGRDLFTRVFDGGRVSLFIAFAAVTVNCIIGVIYGGIAGYFGGQIDNIMMRFVEILNGIPYLLLIIIFMMILPKGIFTIIIAYTVVGWAGMARLVRGEVIRLKEQEFVVCASTMGASSARIIFRHLVPNILSVVIVNLTLAIPSIIFTEAFLSFIGLGVPSPQASWGTLANEGIVAFQRFPSQLIIPALLISLTMLSFNLLGDKLRDAFDPKLRR